MEDQLDLDIESISIDSDILSPGQIEPDDAALMVGSCIVTHHRNQLLGGADPNALAKEEC